MNLFRNKKQDEIDRLRGIVAKQNTELDLLRPLPMDMIKIIAAVLDLNPKKAIGIYLLEQWELLDSLQHDPRFGGMRFRQERRKDYLDMVKAKVETL